MDNLQREVAAATAIRQAVGAYARAILVTTPQGVYAVPVEDQHVGMALRFNGQYSEGELQLLRSFCSNQTRLLVVGAHIGALAIPLARLCRQVVAIEANPETFELLRLNIQLNGLNNCTVLHKAASDKVETLNFLLSRTNTGGSKREPAIKDQAYYYDNPKAVKVDAAPLDDLLLNQAFDVVLMDIEGSEYFALKGMQRILATTQFLQVEFLPHHLTKVAGITIEQFVSVLAPHFVCMVIPHRRTVIRAEQFTAVLQEMCDRQEGDAGLIFTKLPYEQVQFN